MSIRRSVMFHPNASSSVLFFFSLMRRPRYERRSRRAATGRELAPYLRHLSLVTSNNSRKQVMNDNSSDGSENLLTKILNYKEKERIKRNI